MLLRKYVCYDTLTYSNHFNEQQQKQHNDDEKSSME